MADPRRADRTTESGDCLDIETFAHVVAHDLKGPLNGIASLVDFVVDDYADRLDDEGREQLRLIQVMATRGVAMVDGLRQFARVSTAPLNPRTLDLGTVARRVLATVAAAVPTVRLDAIVGPGLPLVSADPALASLVLERLFMNAALFGEGSVRRVSFDAAPGAARTPAGHAAFVLRDDGLGIPERHRAAIFDMFKRLHAADKFGGGVGAGLAVARAVVERHGGTIWAEAGDGPGSAFYFTFPRASAPAPAAAPEA